MDDAGRNTLTWMAKAKRCHMGNGSITMHGEGSTGQAEGGIARGCHGVRCYGFIVRYQVRSEFDG